MKSIRFLLVTLALGAAAVVIAAPASAHGNNKHKSAAAEPMDVVQHPWGIAAAASAATRTIRVTMHDTMRFEPDSVQVADNEVVRFVIANKGRQMHEFVLGDQKVLDEHAAMMVRFPNMEHDEPYMAHVAPGDTGEIVWRFNRGGSFHFACLIPGHYQAGMIGALTVGASKDHAGHAAKGVEPPVLLARADLADGEIKRMKKGSKKLTIKHGDIPNLQMPPMTMVFEAEDESMLADLKRGDKIKFKVIERDGKMVITEIQPAGN